MKKKSYNPFKMWGSYVGALVGGLLSFLSLNFFWYDSLDLTMNINCPIGMGEIARQECINAFYQQGVISTMIFGQYFLYIVTGFLVGYGIHSLIKKLIC